MNRVDAERRGFKDGDPVRVQSASNPEGVWDFKKGCSESEWRWPALAR
jgi:tetrathionate reductase subunit A